MNASNEDIKKSERGRPKVDSTPIMVRMGGDELGKVDAWIAANGPPYVSRPEAIRRLVEKALG
ncbi:CopG family transcriptional regulator [Sphingomonas populi]|uniref:CopG family transcriptional regulator n=1 Tax=Sphingomonas populi TaxID=2484750 RepID=A0A4Q6XTY6_9SPHN|nr:CopG family transcriptional regulator [Sphingomonas populi]RZF64003.1 CopG family transcriptional regulator [Sphingomonas populi]